MVVVSSTCRASKRDGTPCTAAARASGYCIAHDPALGEARRRGAVAGGHGKARLRRLDRRAPADVQGLLDRLWDGIEGVAAGALKPSQGLAIAALAGQILRAHELVEQELRLRQLEARLEALSGPRTRVLLEGGDAGSTD